MTIKEFSHKYSLQFFWATIILLIVVIAMAAGRHGRFERGGMMMRGGNDTGGRMMNRQGGSRGQMMNNNQDHMNLDANTNAGGRWMEGSMASGTVPAMNQ